MATQQCVVFVSMICMVFFMIGTKVEATRPHVLFVFGDSYVDNGNLQHEYNNNLNHTRSWRHPYGMTYPKKPSGRFSDGRVFSDFIAKFLGIRSPTSYRERLHNLKHRFYGMNFARGGSGVFDTNYHQPTLSQQIDNLQEMVHQEVYTECDLASSVALVSVSGNDYSTFVAKNGTDGLIDFTDVVVALIAKGAKRLQEMGVGKVAVTSLTPLGCTPYVTFNSSHKECDFADNMASEIHNEGLFDAIMKLNNATKDSSIFYVDMYNAVNSVIENKGHGKFKTPLVPCCEAFDNENGNCGDADKHGKMQYTLCRDPKHTLYWDSVHPTQAGWAAIYNELLPSLKSHLN